MLIAGAGGHAVETLGMLEQIGYKGRIVFYDDVTPCPPSLVLDSFDLLNNIGVASEWFKKDQAFCLGVGSPKGRRALTDKLIHAGGVLTSVISPYAQIGNHEVSLGQGVTIMTGAIITERINIGMGTLVHVQCNIHHDSVIGEFCELSPGCSILGRVTLGSYVSVGAGAIILPRITIGDGAVIGAGAVVTHNVPPRAAVAGVPARPLQNEQRD